MLGCTVRLLLFAGMPRFVRDATLSPSECISLINSLRVAGRKEYLAEPTLAAHPRLRAFANMRAANTVPGQS